MHALPRFRAAVGGQKIDFATATAGGHDHALAGAELHLPRGQIRHANHQPADQSAGW